MSKPPEFDVAAAHKYFAANCFNEAWALMEKAVRSEEENRRMVLLNQASIYHWVERKDGTAKSLSVGYWQASRIQTLIGNAEEAIRFGNICLSYSGELEPFYLGYAHEALARAYQLSGDSLRATEHLAKSKDLASRVSAQEERELLEADLRQLTSSNR